MGSTPLFTGAAAPLTETSFEISRKYLDVDAPTLWAVLQVETRGCGFFADRRPKVLFERHVFSDRTRGRFDKTHPDLSNPEAGGYTYGPAEHLRLARALALDARAALLSASWGLGQVMGFNFRRVGYESPAAMARHMAASEGEQLCAMALYCRTEGGLLDALQHHHWATFARGYNGPDYRRNRYDEKLAEAFALLASRGLPDLRVREAQVLLGYLGFQSGEADGVLGPKTRAALQRFQARHLLDATGQLDDATLASLQARHAELPRNESAPAGLGEVARG